MEASGERLGFMRAIAANPSDETARLAFRDWLEENGDPVRAEFIRVQTEWAVLGPTAPTPDNIGRAIELTERSRELLAAHESDWRRVECRAVGPHHGDVCDDGRIQSPNAQFTTQCHYCHGSGDVGGLLRERDRPFRNEGGLISHVMTRDPVEWTRGHVSAVACRLGEVPSSRRRSRPSLAQVEGSS